MQNQISWLLQKPTDLDLHCFQRQDISGFSRTRVNLRETRLLVWCSLKLQTDLRSFQTWNGHLYLFCAGHTCICILCFFTGLPKKVATCFPYLVTALARAAPYIDDEVEREKRLLVAFCRRYDASFSKWKVKNSADDILKYFYFSQRNRLWQFIQIVY